ncbi:MAG TPA: ATP-dependent 6-phosphofructokinase [bacterium]|nr:ATP-dependent 6-phosphofructokinase [bacterium]
MKPKKLQRIGVLTAGGDCPGLNAVIRGVTKTAIYRYGLQVWGIEDGYEGLLDRRGRELTSDDVSGILTHGGTILGTSNTADPFRVTQIRGKKVYFEDQSQRALSNFSGWGLDGLIAIGGDGTLSIAQKLHEKGIPVVGIPKTIDNDLSGTDYTFGFKTAVSVAAEALDRLHTTAASHHRVMLLEVMGRNAGWIALYAGTAGGADIILIPEIPFHMDMIYNEVIQRAKSGKRFSLMVVAEGAYEEGREPVVRTKDLKNPHPVKLGGIANHLADQIEKQTGIETRSAVLGHIQRGGSPIPYDRNVGTMFGNWAVELIMQGMWGHMVCLQGEKITSVPIKDAVKNIKKVPMNHPLLKAAEAVGTSFGAHPTRHKAR